ncbi:hypothetical protein SAM40697_6906 [Streptomyces ambofaciens]|uniref:Putative membrane protein n=1 Tax=Streptomyces ambofaciens TaxID=1889 RepID=Q0JWQ7_STRAM|nr:DUF6153 family protein [Streptomyces ambofaciens]ANB03982.1 hypothetical protein SAM40697_0019 [Streptomyces ambofaciens]ANB10858.1 hypothetical protein SAM40697_6906 [Streptomyces ambofaciens]CAK50863.1 putative membrane protein [Streptomyces ambofaciens]CAK51101.1 putative membrane protein [Streptomyces ambofaciens]
MTSSVQLSSRRPAGRLFVLLVLAVLAGLLGMHALGPGGAPSPRAEAGHDMVMAVSADASHASAGCSHTGGGPSHLEHADGSCAAAGIGSAYAPPPLAGALPGTPLIPASLVPAAALAETGRDPPDLSELQLLRI